jgi:hypothetical protein
VSIRVSLVVFGNALDRAKADKVPANPFPHITIFLIEELFITFN